MVGFFDRSNNADMVTVTTHTGNGLRTRRVPRADIEAEQRGEKPEPVRVGMEITPFKDWNGTEKLLGITSAALLLAGAYYGALYLAGTGVFPPEVNHFILNTHHQILQATRFADNMAQTYTALENGQLDVNGALSGAARIGQVGMEGTNRQAINPLMAQFSELFSSLDVSK